MSLSRTLAVAVIALTLSGCLLDDLTKSGGSEPAPSAGSQASKSEVGSPISREKVTEKAAAAMGAKVVGRKGEYLLCNIVDHYKQSTTTYNLCRERSCVGQEQPVENVKAPKTKSGCIEVCRKLERQSRKGSAAKSYCVN
jgi:hypothetical protein